MLGSSLSIFASLLTSLAPTASPSVEQASDGARMTTYYAATAAGLPTAGPILGDRGVVTTTPATYYLFNGSSWVAIATLGTIGTGTPTNIKTLHGDLSWV